uniref:Uncharacterized protein n=1 Tax=Glossina pallidipes TaxID=7398 RepID=A0A1B0AFZ6_GLOPL
MIVVVADVVESSCGRSIRIYIASCGSGGSICGAGAAGGAGAVGGASGAGGAGGADGVGGAGVADCIFGMALFHFVASSVAVDNIDNDDDGEACNGNGAASTAADLTTGCGSSGNCLCWNICRLTVSNEQPMAFCANADKEQSDKATSSIDIKISFIICNPSDLNCSSMSVALISAKRYRKLHIALNIKNNNNSDTEEV